MIKNYFKIAWRNLWRNKAFSFINIFGLSIGIATCLVIMLFVQDELSYDRYNKKADQIVRVIFRASINGEKINEANVMPPVAQTLLADYPEVQQATRVRSGGLPLVTYDNKTFKENGFVFADSNFFQVFTLPFLKGNAATALTQPNTLVISEATSEKYFGKNDPLGKVLSFNGSPLKITGVFKKIPPNSHFDFNLIASMATLPESREPSWMSSNFFTYLVLPEGYGYKKLETKLPEVVAKYMGPQIQQAFGMSYAEFRKKGNDVGLFLQPLTDIHLHSDFSNDFKPASDIRYIYIFGAIALFMLIIACINFMNLSTASASKRYREVGIRKVLGSLKRELIRQFLFESILLTFIALLFAIVLVNLALPVFNQLSGKELNLHFKNITFLIFGLCGFGLIVGALAGSYPAFFLSSFKPVTVLKGKFATGKKSIGLRSGLVVFQFCISVFLIIATTVVFQQLKYIQNTKLGFNKDQVLVLHDTWNLGKNEAILQQELLQDSRVVNASVSGYVPVGPSYGNNNMIYTEDNSAQLVKTLKYHVDEQYIPTLGMQIVAGRNFSKDFSTDTTATIINETAAKTFGWGDKALGKTVTGFKNNNGEKITYRIIGIVKDFHFKSLHDRISPLMMVLGDNSGSIIAKVKTKDIAGLLTSVKKEWSQFSNAALFSYSFMNDDFEATYRAEEKLSMILGIFAGLTIFIACLGLFGLVTFTAEKRTKEIGIRKVLGATVPNVVGLLSKDFLKLVFIANIISWPLAWWTMNKWLQDFAYRITISWWVFFLAGFAALLIALITVSFQAIKAAIANPVKSLRSE